MEKLIKLLNDLPAPVFSEKTFVNDEYTKLYTRMTNFKLVKAVFDYIAKDLPPEEATKFSYFQEFMCVFYLEQMCKMKTLHIVSPATISRIILKQKNGYAIIRFDFLARQENAEKNYAGMFSVLR